MTEKVEQYGDKTITFTKLAKYVLQVYCMPKIMRDVDKPDPMTEGMFTLLDMADEEREEKKEALYVWMKDRTEKKATDTLEEIADEINILLFQACEVAGYKQMLRE